MSKDKEECLDREQGKVGTVQEEFDKLAYAIDAKKIKDLEQALAKSEEDFKALSQEFTQSQNEVSELHQLLDKSEDRVKELEADKKISVMSIYEPLMRSGWHTAAMLKEGYHVNIIMQEDGSIKVKGER